ncbi:MAG: hypothetical protein ACN4GM_09615 [Gammaproteobacteria bacterium]
MPDRNSNSCLPVFATIGIVNILRSLICFLIFLPQAAWSTTDTADNEPVSNQATESVNDKDDSARPVEIGPGGNIKLEGKYRERAESLFDWHGHLLWESRYVSEGRDNLSGKGLVSLSTEFTMGEFSVIPWIADSPSADYSEFNLNVVYGTKLSENLDMHIEYNHIRARDADVRASDNEISLDLSSDQLKQFYIAASIYHSFDADGSFMELGIFQGHRINKSIHISVLAKLGVNSGYVTDGHDGLNHFQMRANMAYHPLEKMEVYAYVGYNRAIDRDVSRYVGDELLGNFFWSGVGITYRF